MALIDQKNQQIIFNKIEKQVAWNNAPKLTNCDPKEFRLCFICKLSMDLNLDLAHATKQTAVLGWVVDLVNAKTMDFSLENLVAVHYGCLTNRNELDLRKEFKQTKSLLWQYNE